MIEKLGLVNFKCFAELEIDLNRLTVFTGANASGKSTVLQALILSDFTERVLKNSKDSRGAVIDINEVFGFQVGAPKALCSQNPVETEEYDIALTLMEGNQKAEYQYSIDMLSPLEFTASRCGEIPAKSFQHLNAERVGPRISNQAGRSDRISFDGENAPYLIDVADRTSRKIPDKLWVNSAGTSRFSLCVEQWMSAILGELQLDIQTDYNKAISELRIKNSLVDSGIVPTLTGFGVSYILPVVVAGLWASQEQNSVLLLENPEAHLHPMAQSNMGKFLALLSDCGVQVIVETHSEHIIDGMRYQLAVLNRAGYGIVNFMERDKDRITVTPITISNTGDLSLWPRGFFDQKQRDLRDIVMLRRSGC